MQHSELGFESRLCPLLTGCPRARHFSLLLPSHMGTETLCSGAPCCPGDWGKPRSEQPFMAQVCVKCVPDSGYVSSLSGRKPVPHQTRTSKRLQTIFMICPERILNSHGRDRVLWLLTWMLVKNQCNSHSCSLHESLNWPARNQGSMELTTKILNTSSEGKLKIRTKKVCTSWNSKIKKQISVTKEVMLLFKDQDNIWFLRERANDGNSLSFQKKKKKGNANI